MSQGTIVQCIGAVTDIQFPREAMPKIYDALALEESNDASFAEKGLTFEVEQQLGDGIVRCIAMGSADGLRRGMKVKNTGAPISGVLSLRIAINSRMRPGEPTTTCGFFFSMSIWRSVDVPPMSSSVRTGQ